MHEQDELLHLIDFHLHLHRDVAIQDIYKLLYQGVFGAEHVLTDVDYARMHLDEEWRRADADDEQHLFEPVSRDGRIVRINLRRGKADGINVAAIWSAFYNSAGQVNASLEDFERAWRCFQELCEKKLLPFAAKAVDAFGQDAKEQGFPARHHSAAYRAANYPAYRVLLKQELHLQ